MMLIAREILLRAHSFPLFFGKINVKKARHMRRDERHRVPVWRVGNVCAICRPRQSDKGFTRPEVLASPDRDSVMRMRSRPPVAMCALVAKERIAIPGRKRRFSRNDHDARFPAIADGSATAHAAIMGEVATTE
jgi:hypothetical protein